MISSELIQAALIAKATSSATLTAAPLSSGTVLEYNYQGTDWSYPCVRLQLESNNKDIDSLGSCPSVAEFSWYVFSEQGSSKQANQLAGRVVAAFEDLSFTQNGIKFSKIKILENIPAIRQDVRTWRAQVRCRSVIHLA
jgi:hypothetical protein